MQQPIARSKVVYKLAKAHTKQKKIMVVLIAIFISAALLPINRTYGTHADVRPNNHQTRAKRGVLMTENYWKEGFPYRFEGLSPPNKASVLVKWHVSRCASVIGKTGYPDQRIYLASACCEYGIIAHELGHALGLVHTHERPDRDKYVKVFVDVDPDTNFDFRNYTKEEVETYNLGYDYGSIMQYSMTDYYGSWDDPAMMPLDGRYNYTLGSEIVSFNDFTMINNRYGCRQNCLKQRRVVKCDNGGYEHPRNCSKCLCPSGFGGDSCNERPNENNCGGILNATQKYQKHTFEFANDRWDWLDGFKRCYWWIKAPNGTAIDIRVSTIEDYAYSPQGCRAAGIEIKANDDQTLTGYRICHKSQIGLVFESKHNLVPIITFTKMSGTSRYTIKYRHVNPERVAKALFKASLPNKYIQAWHK
ncbi:unnamed protein product [Cylicocyclus nassatus]|uniref:Zinc metalloproteinase n=1 Tax=Cylicocyclus nassatus TaxID=53992 RepID=A0AA36GS46_CYLNA|nr:unnamed protein product [Cylicocyclus nassatus]